MCVLIKETHVKIDPDSSNRIALSLADKNETQDWYNRRLTYLNYAFLKIRPTKHVEYAFCVWAGTRHESPTEVVDEFCRRRKGEGSKISKYSMVDKEYWKIPDTHEVFVFREQFYVLIAELTGLSVSRGATKLMHDIYKGDCTFVDFCGLITQEHGAELSSSEKQVLYESIRLDYGMSMPYYYCSSIADEVFHCYPTLPEQELTINVEEVFVHGLYEILGFTEEDHRSFLHLSEDEYTNAKKVGTKDHIDKMDIEFYANLVIIAENKKRLNECKIRRENKHNPKKKLKNKGSQS
jgi:hypothetical protein